MQNISNVADDSDGSLVLSTSLPNALISFTELKRKIGNKKIIIFLDYDGTLAPIVPNPADALIPQHALELLYELSLNHFVAIVTGRGEETIRQFIQLPPSQDSPIGLLTSHGFSIECSIENLSKLSSNSQERSTLHPISYIVGNDYLPYLHSFKDQIIDDLKPFIGTNIEDNNFSLSIHYRHAESDKISFIEEKVDQLLETYPMLKKTLGKKVFEIRLNFKWDKGKAITWLLEFLGYSFNNTEIFPIYLGDDLTDEDAFRELRPYFYSNSIVVGKEEPRLTYALQQLDNSEQVYEYLKLLITL